MANDKPMAAAGVIFAAMFLLGLIDNAVAVIARDTGLWQFHATRGVLAAALLAAMSALGFARLRPNRLWAVALRGGVTGVAMLIYFGSLGFMPVSQVAAGLFTAPIWVMLISALFLGQKVGPTRISAAVLGFGGVLLVLQPFRDGLDPVALIPMASGFFYAIGALATRQWCEGESTLSMLLFFFLWLGLFGVVGTTWFTLFPVEVPDGPDGFLVRGLVWPGPTSWALIGVQVVGSMVAVGMLFRAYQLGEAAQVAIFEYSLLIFAAFWGWLMFGQTLGSSAILGMGLIAASGAVISLRTKQPVVDSGPAEPHGGGVAP
ncbi:DMT family transporter [Aliiroseovarius sp.]|uniref:DMT family transporter n=1 Tax=Aliiroseovarius sp. TaxID=1872442 RepID=UPI00260258EB|nr:DMT family transporter [Aliiroseovarius sp.]